MDSIKHQQSNSQVKREYAPATAQALQGCYVPPLRHAYFINTAERGPGGKTSGQVIHARASCFEGCGMFTKPLASSKILNSDSSWLTTFWKIRWECPKPAEMYANRCKSAQHVRTHTLQVFQKAHKLDVCFLYVPMSLVCSTGRPLNPLAPWPAGSL